MSDYISRDAVLNSRLVIEVYDANEDIVDWGVSFDVIKAIPAADVAPVVRCQKCKYYAEFRTKKNGQIMRLCYRMGRKDMEYHVNPDDFCSYGEPREEG